MENYTCENYAKEVKEIIDGKIYYMAGGTYIHVAVITRLCFEFNLYFKNKDLKCMAYSSDLKIFLNENRKDDYVLPDVSVICDKSKFFKNGYKGSPQLIVEVISNSTRNVDKITKLKLYERAQVKEYWIVEPEFKYIEQYVLNENGKFDLVMIFKLLKEEDFNDLNEDDKKNYKEEIKPTIFPDLEMKLQGVFLDESDT